MQQLTIFDAMVSFDETKAEVKTLAGYRYCDLLVIIPKSALNPIEQKYYGPGDPVKDMRHKLWSEYTIGIWHYESCEWIKADNILKYHRDNNIPAKRKLVAY